MLTDEERGHISASDENGKPLFQHVLTIKQYQTEERGHTSFGGMSPIISNSTI
jgi:hypothetical protein